MRVLLGLGDSKLLHAQAGDIDAESIGRRLRRVSQCDVRHFRVVLRHADVTDVADLFLSFKCKTIKFRIHKGSGDLPRPVRTEVEHDDRVSVAHKPVRIVVAVHNSRQDEFVVFVSLIGVSDRLLPCCRMHAFAYGHGVIGLHKALPAFVSVHSVVAAAHDTDLPQADFFHVSSQLVHIFLGAPRRHVSAVQETVHHQFLYAFLLRQIDQGQQMGDVAVHAPVRQQSLQMECRVVFLHMLDRLQESLILKEIPVLNGLGDPCQLLVHDPACADVQMPDLGIAHLAFRQPHIQPAGLQRRPRVFREYFIEMRFVRRFDRVALFSRIDPVSVQYHQHCWSSEICHIAPPYNSLR